MSLKNCVIIKIRVPIEEHETLPRDNAHNLEFWRENSPHLQKVLGVIYESDGIGCVGKYENVYKTEMGEERFTAGEGASPKKGTVGVESGGKVIIVTTYAIDMDREQIQKFVEKVVDAHPWEHPVIECYLSDNAMVWMP